MRSGFAIALLSAVLVCGCGQKAPAPRGASAASEAAPAAAPSANPDITGGAQLATVDFCQMRQQGPADLGAFLDASEKCDGLTDAAARQAARCGALSADETRLRAKYAGQSQVIQTLDQARTRPWPVCQAPAPQPDATVDAAGDQTDQSDAAPAGGDQAGQ